MLSLEDYRGYKKEKKEILQTLKHNASMLYDRFLDITRVLDFILEASDEGEEINEELTTLFEIGFLFLDNQLGIIDMYYNEVLKKDIILFKRYEKLLNYYLYIIDLMDSIENAGLYKDKVKEAYDDLCTKIEDIITNKDEYNDETLDGFNAMISFDFKNKDKIFTTIELFGMANEELM